MKLFGVAGEGKEATGLSFVKFEKFVVKNFYQKHAQIKIVPASRKR